ncbi:hypothetical protein DFH07DRAFT_945316 [Mycena maculata]|uniref:Secreted protein n=1 Tax=Mycena maculata TaxID=230809 RepID=A0AAD7HY40_9AGAR|nr:hypothetical protein DFH07DRAFT_945316 [Mycena maculata]
MMKLLLGLLYVASLSLLSLRLAHDSAVIFAVKVSSWAARDRVLPLGQGSSQGSMMLALNTIGLSRAHQHGDPPTEGSCDPSPPHHGRAYSNTGTGMSHPSVLLVASPSTGHDTDQTRDNMPWLGHALAGGDTTVSAPHEP